MGMDEISESFFFDQPVDRRVVPAAKFHPLVLGPESEGLFAAGVADMGFKALGLVPDELTRFLREKAGWAVTGGHALGAEGAGFARLNIACPHARLAAALDQLAAALGG